MKDKTIEMLRGIAIISVVFAHCHNRVIGNAIDEFLNNIAVTIGTVGVPIFLIISGYLFHKKQWRFFIVSKRNILVSWMFTGCCIWGYEVAKNGLEYANLIDWLIGKGTYLWYMMSLLLFWLLYQILEASERVHIVILILSIISTVCVDCFESVAGFTLSISSTFANFIYWLSFFSIGVCMKDAKAMKRMSIKAPLKNLIFICALCSWGGVMYINDNIISYRCKGFLLFALSSAYVIFFIVNSAIHSNRLEKFNKPLVDYLSQVGNNSYAIYLLHMPLAGVASNLASRAEIGRMLVLIYPIIVCLVMNLVCQWLRKFSSKLPLTMLGIIK